MSLEDPDARVVEVGAKSVRFGANFYNSRGSWLGRGTAAVAVGCVVLEIVAIAVGNDRHWTIATWLGYALIGLTAVGFLGGLAAVILRRGGVWGVAAMIVSVLANPLVQIAVLGLFGSS